MSSTKFDDEPCRACEGLGEIESYVCQDCDGAGWYPSLKPRLPTSAEREYWGILVDDAKYKTFRARLRAIKERWA